MLIGPDTNLLVVHRRLFEADHSRFFVGKVDGYDNGVAKVTGISWTRDQYGNLVRKPDRRTKVLALSSGTLIVYQLPQSVDLANVQMQSNERGVFLTDGKDLEMDLSETPYRGGARHP